MKVTLCVPTLNAQKEWSDLTASIARQSKQPDDIIVVDSSSTDRTMELARAHGYRAFTIARNDFGHGRTRQLCSELAADADILIYVTQDAILASVDSLKLLLSQFDDPQVGAVYGRQLPRPGATPIERFARLFNYQDRSELRSTQDIQQLGFKTIFFSNSFGAYRHSVLRAVGGFPVETAFGEDTQVVAKIILAGGKVAYAADATVYHSHALSVAEEFRRYRQIGIMHRSESWLVEQFGRPSGEGRRYVMSELNYLMREAPHLVPVSLLRTASKYCGYQLGGLISSHSPR